VILLMDRCLVWQIKKFLCLPPSQPFNNGTALGAYKKPFILFSEGSQLFNISQVA
jgi:hypothetical protein